MEGNFAHGRRKFIKAGLGAVAASALISEGKAYSSNETLSPAIMSGSPEITVIGAGVMGVFTALNLQEKGYKVSLVDAYGPGNPRQTSSDESRQTR